ncbi:hypothetical protein [Sulfurovum sp.]|uniref:hypothetical protein n=1 Tax=Sulfurovum sp. TaxID=1969726 RepID=UPI0035650528
MAKFKNTKTLALLKDIITSSLDNDGDTLTSRCKFNFSYFDSSQPAGQGFSDWGHNELIKLLEKLVNYSKEPLSYWKNQKNGKQNILEIYGDFPKNSDFEHPKYIPHQAQWGRFRLEAKVRLIGFVLPSTYDNTVHKVTAKRYDVNTFYVVFLDKDHMFYKIKK